MSVYIWYPLFPKVRSQFWTYFKHNKGERCNLSNFGVGLFHRAISQSGHPLLTIMRPGTARKTAWDFARIVGCYNNITKSEQLLKCLQKVPTKILLQEWAYSRVKIWMNQTAFSNIVFICQKLKIRFPRSLTEVSTIFSKLS